MEIQIGSDRKPGRGIKIAGAAVLALFVVVLLLDLTVLRGERIARLTVGFGMTDAETIMVDRAGVEHLVEIDTRHRRNGENRGWAIEIRLLDPDGTVVYEHDEWNAHKERFFSFTPKQVGSYRLELRPGGVMTSSISGRARVGVFVGDRRILSRVLAALPFLG